MLMCVTASHKNATFDLLERLSVGAEGVAARLVEHHECVSGAVVVATCNRFEAYIDLDEPVTAAASVAFEAAAEAVSETTGIPAEQLREVFDLSIGTAAAEHLFAVSAGLESVVVGEGEIAGQVRRSLEAARAGGTTSSELERLFQRASQTSRGIKNRTPLGRAGRSIVRLALDLAESRIDDWATQRVLLVGTGAYAGASLAALRDRGVTDVLVYSPSGRAEKFARSHEIGWIGHDDLARTTGEVDIIVTCTTAEGHVVDAELLRAGRTAVAADHRARAAAATDAPTLSLITPADAPAAPEPTGVSALVHDVITEAAAECPVPHASAQLVIDLGLPRNVDPDVATVSGVVLLDLETIRIHAPLEELQATEVARSIVSRAAQKFAAVGEERSLEPAVVALRSHVHALVEAEVARATARGDDDGSTARALRHLAGVLLHEPTVRARNLARNGEQAAYTTALQTLFGIEVPQAPAVIAPVADTDSAASAS
ncbi:glutamyl-tRNA reductase [Plantibacter sp. MMLR14_011]|uniref:glutamyl-tRNA reductase n=1 Tax=Plantibacter sp. MMLR14_011 TaxID=1898746 RepID=UPI0008DC5C35|nr:glutamyl-tRNA reductase [Plantibacter sp. MMLR14_011]OII42140.1 glutamyl-tRNA reductase [Plantibacter sp. MMLR14_011]